MARWNNSLAAMCTFAVLVTASLVAQTTPAAASPPYGGDWLAGGALSGTLRISAVVDSISEPNPDPAVGGWRGHKEVSATIDVTTQRITDSSFRHEQSASYLYTPYSGDEPTHCSESITDVAVGPAAPRYQTVVDAAGDGATGLYMVKVRPFDFPASRTHTQSDGCKTPGTVTTDYIEPWDLTVDASCSSEPGFGCYAAERTRLVGSDEQRHESPRDGSQATTWVVTVSWDLTWTPPEACVPVTTRAGDSDGDRLPDTYESSIGTDASERDTDHDCTGDADEVVAGSNPLDPAETPLTLPQGKDPRLVESWGGAHGATCGTARFGWVTPAGQSLGVGSGRPACIFLLSNPTARRVLDYALTYDVTMTQALQQMTQPYLAEIYGDPRVDWVKDQAVSAAVWGAKQYLKKAMLQGYNLTKLNAVFLAGQAAGLSSVAIGAGFAASQVRTKNACLQVRIGTASDGHPRLSWSLVYSRELVTDRTLSIAGTWKRIEQPGPDDIVRRSINLSCNGGYVEAHGRAASAVLTGAASHVF